MMVAKIRNIISVTIATILTGYANRTSTWTFCPGNPWPVASYARTSISGNNLGTTAIACDVFYRDAGGVAHVTMNQFGSMTSGDFFTGTNLPAFWNNRIMGFLSTTYNLGGANTFPHLSRYNIGAPLGTPILMGSIPQVGTTAPKLAAATFDPNAMGACVLMPVLGSAEICYAPDNTLVQPHKLWDTTDVLFTTFASGVGGPILNGAIPGTAYYIVSSAAPSSQMAINAAGAITTFVVTWDDANLNTIMQGATGLSQGYPTIFGTLNYIAAPTVINGISYSHFLVLTAPDGSYYDIIKLSAGDAASTTALSAIGGTRSAILTPDSFLWFASNSNNLDHVYGVALPTGSLSTKLLPIFYPQALPNPPKNLAPYTRTPRHV